MYVDIPEPVWYGGGLMKLTFPEEWEVEICKMEGHDSPALSASEMRSAFENPIGSERISDLAKGRREAVIIFDDMASYLKNRDTLTLFKELIFNRRHIRTSIFFLNQTFFSVPK